MTTRRDVIRIICAGAAMTGGFPTFSQAKGTTSTLKKSAKSPLFTQKVLRPGQQSFDEKLEELFPGLGVNSIFREKIYRSSSLVFNDGPHPVYGYGVIWRGRKAGATVERYRRLLVDIPDEGFNSTPGSFHFPFLRAGDVALVSPFYEVTSRAYQRAGKDRLHENTILRNAAALRRASGFVDRSDDMDEIRMTIDAVAFANFVVGSDSLRTSNSIRNIVNGEHDEAQKLLSRSQDKHGDVAVRTLIEAAQGSILSLARTDRPHIHAEYLASRAHFANRILLLSSKGNDEKTAHILKLAAMRKRISIR
jgi:hypothetical protein